AFLALTALTSCLFWMLYIALEPFIRRKCPQTLISWTRVLAGEWRDPQVGRDLLAGAAFGAAMTAVTEISALGLRARGLPLPGIPSGLLGIGDFILSITQNLQGSTALALAFLCAIFFYKMNRAVGATLILLFAVGNMLSTIGGPWFGLFGNAVLLG